MLNLFVPTAARSQWSAVVVLRVLQGLAEVIFKSLLFDDLYTIRFIAYHYFILDVIVA